MAVQRPGRLVYGPGAPAVWGLCWGLLDPASLASLGEVERYDPGALPLFCGPAMLALIGLPVSFSAEHAGDH